MSRAQYYWQSLAMGTHWSLLCLHMISYNYYYIQIVSILRFINFQCGRVAVYMSIDLLMYNQTHISSVCEVGFDFTKTLYEEQDRYDESVNCYFHRSVQESESRTPNIRNLGVRKSDSQYQEIQESESRTPNIRKSWGPNVSCEVSRQIGLIIRPQPYSSGSSVIKVFALRVAPPRFKSRPAQLFCVYFF